jgi:hypothetical protein
MTIDQAHMIATSGDRIFHVDGHVRGEWYSDRVLDFMVAHKNEKCRVLLQNDHIISVKLEKEAGNEDNSRRCCQHHGMQ